MIITSDLIYLFSVHFNGIVSYPLLWNHGCPLVDRLCSAAKLEPIQINPKGYKLWIPGYWCLAKFHLQMELESPLVILITR